MDINSPNLENSPEINSTTSSKGFLYKLYHWSGTWTGTVVIVLGIIFFLAQAFVIPSGSMKNSLLIGDMLFVKKFSYGIPIPRIPWLEVQVLPDLDGDGHLISANGPQRGDIVVFRYPKDEKIHYVKRCVATGGDLIFLKDKNLYLHPKEGNEYVIKNFAGFEIAQLGDKLFVENPYKKDHQGIHNDPAVTQNGMQPMELFYMMPIEIPQGEYFMMGDNRDHSNDSRFWGTVPYKYIVGKPWFIYFSWDEDKKVRWDRVFKTPEYLEKTHYTENKNIKHKEGIY